MYRLTMVFLICCAAKEGSSVPVKDWFGCTPAVDITLLELYCEFCNGMYDGDPIDDDMRCAFSCVKVGASKSIKDLTKVSSSSSVTDVEKNLGSFVMFPIPAEVHHRGHGDTDSDDDGSAKPSVFSVLMANANARSKSLSLPPAFPEQRHPQKSKLKNAILKWLETSCVGWSPDTVGSLGLTFVNTIASLYMVN